MTAFNADKIIASYAASSAHLFVLDSELTQLEQRVKAIKARDEATRARLDVDFSDIYERLERLERARPSTRTTKSGRQQRISGTFSTARR